MTEEKLNHNLERAKKRIEKAKEKQFHALGLNDIQLTQFPKEITELKNLQWLD
jgi:hypothetical protein